MGRNKCKILTKNEKKRLKDGTATHWGEPGKAMLVDGWRITAADLVAWRQNLTERFGDLDAATRTARRTVLNSSFWAEQIRAMA